MNVVRLIVAGSVGAGKSTLIQTVSENGCVSTEELATDRTSQLKPTTTVALDFSRVTLDRTIHLYGTPGQARFDFMWEILLKHADRALLLIAAHRPVEFAATREILSVIRRSQIPITIGVTHTDCPGAVSFSDISNEFDFDDLISIDSRDRASVLQALAIAVDPMAHSHRSGL